MAIKKTPKNNQQPVENANEVVKKKRGRPRKDLSDPFLKTKKIKEQRKQALIESRIAANKAEKSDIHGNSLYSLEMAEKARGFLLLSTGATDRQLSEFLGINDRTLYRWANEHAEFKSAITEGRIGADIAIASSLFRRANGYTSAPEIKEEISDDGEGNEIKKITTTIKEIPPDVTAQKHWLSLRQPKIWRTPNISGIMERFQSGELSAQDAAIEIESMGVALPDVLKMTLAKEMGVETAEYKPVNYELLDRLYEEGAAAMAIREAALVGRGVMIEKEINEAKNGK